MARSTQLLAAVVNMNSPGSYLHWSIFTVSVANLVLIAVMVAIFGGALLLPFPGRHKSAATPADSGPDAAGAELLGAPVAATAGDTPVTSVGTASPVIDD